SPGGAGVRAADGNHVRGGGVVALSPQADRGCSHCAGMAGRALGGWRQQCDPRADGVRGCCAWDGAQLSAVPDVVIGVTRLVAALRAASECGLERQLSCAVPVQATTLPLAARWRPATRGLESWPDATPIRARVPFPARSDDARASDKSAVPRSWHPTAV